jgi:hypothetical protein
MHGTHYDIQYNIVRTSTILLFQNFNSTNLSKGAPLHTTVAYQYTGYLTLSIRDRGGGGRGHCLGTSSMRQAGRRVVYYYTHYTTYYLIARRSRADIVSCAWRCAWSDLGFAATNSHARQTIPRSAGLTRELTRHKAAHHLGVGPLLSL